MKSSIKRSSLLAVLATFGATFVATRDTYAGATTSAISISGGLVQGSGGGSGDPPYIYVFDVYVESGTWDSLQSNPASYLQITIDGLVGVSPSGYFSGNSAILPSTTSQPGTYSYNGEQFLGSIDSPTITSAGPLTGFNYYSDVTWTYAIGSPLTTTSGSPAGYIGQFEVVTSWQDYEAGNPPIPIGSTINYSYNGNSGNGNGQIIVTNGFPGVPEPSSMILMMMGAIVLPYAAIRRHVRSRRV